MLGHLLELFTIASYFSRPQARLLGTLAVSRGLGDHQLRVLDTNIQLKPFLLSVPQVRVQGNLPQLPSAQKGIEPDGSQAGMPKDRWA